MKNLTHWTQRSLALLLALVMCLGMVQMSAFAADGTTDPVTEQTEQAEGIEEVQEPEEPETTEEVKDTEESETTEEVKDTEESETTGEVKDTEENAEPASPSLSEVTTDTANSALSAAAENVLETTIKEPEISTYAVMYSVIFDPNGAEGTPPEPLSVPDWTMGLDSLPDQGNLTKDGYTFVGWAQSADGKVPTTPGNVWVFGGNVTLYAIWEAEGQKSFTVRLNYDSNLNATVPSEKPVSVEEGETASWTVKDCYVTPPQGKKFAGWNTKADGTGDAYQAGETISVTPTENTTITLYAQWEEIVSIVTEGNVCTVTGNGTTAFDPAQITTDAIGDANTLVLDGFTQVNGFGSSTVFAQVRHLTIKNVDAVGAQAFYVAAGGMLSSVTLENVKTVGDYAFFFQSALQTVTVNNVGSIGVQAFAYCYAANSVALTDVTSVGNQAFYLTGNNSSSGLVVALKDTNISADLATSVYPFYGCGMTELIVDGADSLGALAFFGCTSLKEATIKNVKTVSGDASYTVFHSCVSLEKVTLENVDEIGQNAFTSLGQLYEVTLTDVGTVRANAFHSCAQLNSISGNAKVVEDGAIIDCKTQDTSNIKIPVCDCTEICTNTANKNCPVCKENKELCTSDVVVAQVDLYFHFVPTDNTEKKPTVKDIPDDFNVDYSYSFDGQERSGKLDKSNAYQFKWDIDDPNYQLHQSDPAVHWVLPIPHKIGTPGTTVKFELHDYEISGFTYKTTYSTDLSENGDGKGAIRIKSDSKDSLNLHPGQHFYNRYEETTFTVTWLDGYSDKKTVKTYKVSEAEKYKGEYPTDPTRTDYTFTGWGKPVIDETTGNITITAQWKENTFTVTWLNGYGDNEVVKTEPYGKITEAEKYKGEYPDAPTRPGSYQFDGWGDPVIGDNGNITITAQWEYTGGGGSTTVTRYDLTIHYVYEDGTQAAPDHTERVRRGSSYSVDSPAIEGYTPNRDVVTGRMNGDVTVTVTYTANPVDIPDENPPLTEDPNLPDEPTVPDEPPVVDIPDEDPPLVDIPEEDPPLVDIPEEDPPLVDIPEEDPPLVDEPSVDIPEENPPLTDAPVVSVPDSNVPQTGEASTALWLAAALLAGAGLVYLNTGRRKER